MWTGAVQAVTLTEIDEKPLELRIENTFYVEWHNDHEFGTDAAVQSDDYVKLMDELVLDLKYDRFLIGARLEAYYYPDHLYYRREIATPDGTSVLYEERKSKHLFNPQRLYFVFDSGRFRVDVGDYYATFGRGLALSMRKEGTGELDNSLRGVKFELRQKNTSFTMLAGFTNTLNTDPYSESYQSDPNDFIAGVRAEQRILDTMILGAHAVDAHFGMLEKSDKQRFIPEKQTSIVGGSIEFPSILGYLSLYFEGNYMGRTGRRLTEDLEDFETVSDSGHGLYASLNLYIENFTFTAEYKRYRDFVFRRGRTVLGYALQPGEEEPEDLLFFEDIWYNNVPTLERTDLETTREYGNDSGFRLRAEYNVFETGTRPYVAFYFDYNKSANQGSSTLGGFEQAQAGWGDRIWHVYGGLTQMIGAAEVYIDGGWRDEQGEERYQLAHAKAGAAIPLVGAHSINLEGSFMQKDYQFIPKLERDVDATFGYTFQGYFSVSLFYTMQQLDVLPSAGEDEFLHFVAAEIASRFSDRIVVSVFGGQVRESYRCYGGFCRLVPAFEGVKAKLTLRF